MQMISLGESYIGQEVKQTVNARDLHSFLELSTRFNDWIATRIEQFSFLENQDFVAFTEDSVKGRPSKEYALTLEMAKELSMVERNTKGKVARQYFIECERKATTMQVRDPQTKALIQLLVETDALKVAQEHLDKRLTAVETKQISVDESRVTAAGFCNMKGIRLNVEEMKQLGSAAKNYSVAMGLPIGKVHSIQWGQVNEYAVEALEAVIGRFR